MADFWEFINAAGHYWSVRVSGVGFAVLGLLNQFFSGSDTVDKKTGQVHHHPLLPSWVFWVALGVVAVWAFFLAWRDMKGKRDDLAEQLARPRVDLRLVPVEPEEVDHINTALAVRVVNDGPTGRFVATLLSVRGDADPPFHPHLTLRLAWLDEDDAECRIFSGQPHILQVLFWQREQRVFLLLYPGYREKAPPTHSPYRKLLGSSFEFEVEIRDVDHEGTQTQWFRMEVLETGAARLRLIDGAAQDQPAVMTGGQGGDGFFAGGGGGVAKGSGSYAAGGQAGGGVSRFEALARAALNAPIPLAEFIRLAGHEPDDPELDAIFGAGGTGGGAGDEGAEPGEDGASGLVIVTSFGEDGHPIQVDVFDGSEQDDATPSEDPG